MTKIFKSSCQAGFLQLQRKNVCIINTHASSEYTPLFSNLQTFTYNHKNIEIFNVLIVNFT